MSHEGVCKNTTLLSALRAPGEPGKSPGPGGWRLPEARAEARARQVEDLQGALVLGTHENGHSMRLCPEPSTPPSLSTNSFTEVCLTCDELHALNRYNLVTFDTFPHSGNHHNKQDNDTFMAPEIPSLALVPPRLSFPVTTDLLSVTVN